MGTFFDSLCVFFPFIAAGRGNVVGERADVEWCWKRPNGIYVSCSVNLTVESDHKSNVRDVEVLISENDLSHDVLPIVLESARTVDTETDRQSESDPEDVPVQEEKTPVDEVLWTSLLVLLDTNGVGVG